MNLPDNISEAEVQKIYQKEGRALFDYFQKYFGDPASTARKCINRHFSEIAKEQYRNRTLQQERMNSAWRYQFIAKDAAIASKRFESVSELGLYQADFNIVIRYKKNKSKLAIYVSVKNRSDTVGGQDMPKAIIALEDDAKLDKNRDSPYLCVFGITMERGLRLIRKNQKSGVPHSINTELWLSDYFWPFFTNMSYEDMMRTVLEILLTGAVGEVSGGEMPQELLDSFETCCREHKLLDKKGKFNDPFKLVELFCRKKNAPKPKQTTSKMHNKANE